MAVLLLAEMCRTRKQVADLTGARLAANKLCINALEAGWLNFHTSQFQIPPKRWQTSDHQLHQPFVLHRVKKISIRKGPCIAHAPIPTPCSQPLFYMATTTAGQGSKISRHKIEKGFRTC